MSSRYVEDSALSPEELKKCYTDLKEKMQVVLYYMDQCLNYLNDLENDLISSYSIDGEKISSIKIENMKSTLSQRINTLRRYIMPEINVMKNSF